MQKRKKPFNIKSEVVTLGDNRNENLTLQLGLKAKQRMTHGRWDSWVVSSVVKDTEIKGVSSYLSSQVRIICINTSTREVKQLSPL